MTKFPNIKIFVTHFNNPNCIYEDDIFIPIQAGKKNSKIDLGIQGDNTGDNISDKNSQYGELTTQYWVWKNYDLSGVDYVGFCHYRRYLTFNFIYNKLKFWNNFSKDLGFYGNLISIMSYLLGWQINLHHDENKIKQFDESIIREIGKEYDIYLPKRQILLFIRPFHMLGLCNGMLWEILKDIIIKKDGSYDKTLKRVDNLRLIHWCNLGIMKKNIFIEYSEWLFGILFEFEKQLENKNLLYLGFKERITSGSRFLGCLGENLFNLYVEHQKELGKTISYDANIIFFNSLKI